MTQHLSAHALYNKGTDAFHKRKYDKAAKLLKESLKIDESREAYLNLGACYKQQGDLKRALACFEKSLARDPKYSLALNNIGLIYHMWNQEDKADGYFAKALEIDPNYADAGWNLSLSTLKRAVEGERELFEKGWATYEWRFHKTNPVILPHTTKPRWLGQTDCKLLVLAEQGVGDNIMFMRYLPYIVDHVDITVVAPENLHTFYNGYNVIDHSNVEHDYYVPICSLGAYFNMIPTGSYLNYSGELREDLAGGIGIVWKGNPEHGNDINRSTYEGNFKRFAKYGKLYSLQYGEKAKFSENLYSKSWEDTIRFISSLDAVITIDSSVAHVAGAMGKKVFILIPGIDTDFRWGLTGDKCLWYENATLIRNMNFDEAERKVAEWRNSNV